MNDKLKASKRVIVYEELLDDCFNVSDNDIREYSDRLGIDLKVNPQLATAVRDWILQPLPRYWFPCRDTQTGHWFYSNALNGQSTWCHPLEEIHRNLAKEFVNSQYIPGTERENPEGESAEQSMESGYSGAKGLGNVLSPLGVIPSVRTQLPRALAPLKRVPKVDPTTLFKTSETIIPPFGAASNLYAEQVREVSFSTFKSPDHIPSLLPGDLLYENRDRPVNNTTVSISSSLQISTPEGLRSKSLLKNEDQAPTETKLSQRHLSPRKKLTEDENNGAELTCFDSNIEAEPVVQESKPRVSFTERLAAKKASRIKSNESMEACLSNPSESDQTSASLVLDKKHVHFDLEVKEVRHYTPECSEETKVADKSESSSSEDILDLVGDPEFLKPLSDLNCQYPTAFEEKRWEVSFTSFGLNDANGSPVKTNVTDTEDCNEMVTRFNSEYCPSPLPVSPCTENSDDIHITIEPTVIPTDQFQTIHDVVESNSCVPSEMVSDSNVCLKSITPEVETNVPTLNESPQKLASGTQTVFVPFQDELIANNHLGFQNSPTTIEEAKQEPSSISHPISLLTVEATEPSESLVNKIRVPKITRCITRSDSLEYSIMSVQSDPVIIQDLHPPSTDPLTYPIGLQNNIAETNVNLIIEPISSQLASPLLYHNSVSQLSTTTSVQKEETKLSQICVDQQIPPLENWLEMKREMESTLENEKKRLESWFTSEIAQIKKQFENELATERERTENLSRLVESAKSEKEELAKREIVRLEETLAHLVEEKARQVQTLLTGSKTNQSNYCSVDRQDANVQTEEPTTPPRNLPLEQRASSLDEIGTADSNHARNESHSRSESRDSPSVSRRDFRIKCQCDSLQKQVARVEREMQLLKQKNLSFQKNPPTRKKSTPVKAQRESWWLDTDESATSTASSVSDRRYSRGRSQSMTNLHASRDASSGRKSTPIQRARDLLSKSQTPRRAWMEDLSTDQSSGDTPTSGISSAISTGEWDTVLSSIQKISGDLQEVWSHIGPRPRPLPYLSSYQSPLWMPSSQLYSSDRVPLHWSYSGSTAERTQALRLWLQHNKSQHSKPLL